MSAESLVICLHIGPNDRNYFILYMTGARMDT